MPAQVKLCMLMVLLAPLCLARYTPSEHDNGGSGDYTMGTLPTSPLNNALSTNLPEDEVKNSNNGTTTNKTLLDGILDFFKEYMLLMVVVGSLVFMMIFIVCAAVIVRQKHQATAYYPSSFPKKKYVDEKDRSGGSQAFSEVPEITSDANVEEPVDCSKKLQADIVAAAHGLKSPCKPVANGEPAKIEEQPKLDENTKLEEVKGKVEEVPSGAAGTKMPEKTEPVPDAPSGTEGALPPNKCAEPSANEGGKTVEKANDPVPAAKGDSNAAKDSAPEAASNECSGPPATATQTSDASPEV
ncbi:transmembrane protein 119 [Ambystoma mexicanum]|uniref:transmembrane protein 119 n=1 Tax=Ambystoma mexicanum TaxID=8296 RepID=UPI0037E70994